MMTDDNYCKIILDNIIDLIVINDSKGIFLYTTPSVKSVLGYEVSQLIGNKYLDYIHPDDLEIVKSALGKFEKGEIAEATYRFRHSNGNYVWLESKGKPVKNNDGTINVIVSSRDITDRDDLRVSDWHYRMIVENTNDAIYIHDFEGNIIDVNDNACKMVGYDRNELVGANLAMLDRQWHHSESVATAGVDSKMRRKRNSDHEDLERLISDRKAVFERINIRKDGSEITVEVSVRVVSYEGQGTVAAYVRDITARRHAETAIRRSEERLKDAQRIARMGDVTWNVETGEIAWSDSIYEMMQYDKTEEIDFVRVNKEMHHPDDLERITAWLNDCLTSGDDIITPNEYRIIRKDGSIIFVHTTGVIQRSSDKGTKVFVTLQDITELKRSEAELQRYRESLETMVAERTRELEERTIALGETNTAMKVLLKHREDDKADVENRFVMNIRRLVLPFIEKMRETRLDERQSAYLSIVISHLNNIASPLTKKFHQFNLTPTETEVAVLIKDGRSTKEIASIMGLATASINTHRVSIRRKLGISKEDVNLSSYLQSFH